MKTYNFEKAKQLISENSENLVSASLGMHEDWSWTASIIWEDGEYKRELPDNADELETLYREKRKNGMSMFSGEKDENGLSKTNPEWDECTKHNIGGIYGSGWATPALELIFKSGEEKMIPCYNGDSSSEKPMGFELGCLSAPVQERIAPLS